jgi:hypothetical protein
MFGIRSAGVTPVTKVPYEILSEYKCRTEVVNSFAGI